MYQALALLLKRTSEIQCSLDENRVRKITLLSKGTSLVILCVLETVLPSRKKEIGRDQAMNEDIVIILCEKEHIQED